MSRTKIHKEKAKFKQGLTEKISWRLKNHWNRRNRDWGEFRALKLKIAEKDEKENRFR